VAKGGGGLRRGRSGLALGAVLAAALLAAGFVPAANNPFSQVGSKLVASDEAGPALFGSAVALSGDGKTALVGGQTDDNDTGAAWVFALDGGTWTQQGAKLLAPGGPAEGDFGESVALSADGNTALVGQPQLDDMAAGPGYVWVYTRPGGKWARGPRLAAGDESGNGGFGSSVALSANGTVALIGGRLDNSAAGAAWVFTRSGSTWTQQGKKLTGGDEKGPGWFGASVALSGDGTTALVGGTNDAGTTGAAWVFTSSGGAWTQQGAKLTGGGEAGGALFGIGVALSADGNTALVGGYADDGQAGAGWVFARGSDGTWAQQGSKLAPGEKGAAAGTSVALSGDGATALIGAPFAAGRVGHAWLYGRSAAGWARGARLAGTGEVGAGLFGTGVALSQDGSIALVGGREDDDEGTDAPALRRNAGLGAGWVFSTKPGAAVAATATGARTAKVGQTVTIALTVANRGPMGDAGVSLSSLTAGGSSSPVATPRCAAHAGQVDCAVGTLAKGATASRTVSFVPERAGTYTTTVTVAGSQLDLAASRVVVTTKVGG
jgi:FG-GAP repeat/Domain of unknown function DUF11